LVSTARLLAADPSYATVTGNPGRNHGKYHRWQWLDRLDLEYVRARYVAAAPRLLVLGGRHAAAGGLFAILRPGRYRIRPLAGDSRPSVDGLELPPDGVAILAAGTHAWCGSRIAWTWVGPRLLAPAEPHALLPNGDLFITD
jgi:hypothetical protein